MTRLLVWVAWWLLVLHLAAISVWALFFWYQQCLPDAESSFYFSGVTYSTLGYGDLVLPKEWRLFGSGGRLDRHPDVRPVCGVLLRRPQPSSPWSNPQPNGTDFMKPLLEEIRHNKLLWLLAFVPAVFAAKNLRHDEHTLLFVLSVLAIVPLAALLSHATESVAAKTGDAIGGLLNATLGNLTELVIALTALARRTIRAGEGVAGRRHRHQHVVHARRVPPPRRTQVSRPGIQPRQRPHAGRSALPGNGRAARFRRRFPRSTRPRGAAFTQKLSVGLSVLLIVAYALSMFFSMKTHPELFASAESGEAGAHAVADGPGPGDTGRRHGPGRAG